MKMNKISSILVLCVVLLLVIALANEQVHAASKNMEKKGFDALGSKEIDAAKLPNMTKKVVGLGSVVVAFIVFKWL